MGEIAVAPLVGAWIETGIFETLGGIVSVAPLVGAWIETVPKSDFLIRLMSRSPRGSVD